MTRPQLIVQTPERLRVEGDLTFATVPDLLTDRVWPRAQVTVDLGGVGATDSAAVALLLEWCRVARQHDSSLRLEACPERLQQLVKVHGVESLFQPPAA